MSADPIILRTALGLFGVELTAHEADVASAYSPREALLMALADREVSARFDAAHGRPPMDDDVDELLDVYFAIEAKRDGA
jgi:hypothetical protein